MRSTAHDVADALCLLAKEIGGADLGLQDDVDGTGFEREQGYKYPHDYPGHWVKQQYLPDELKDRVYYTYGDNKTEQAAKRYWEEIRK